MRGVTLAALLASAQGMGNEAYFGNGAEGQLINFGSPLAAVWSTGECSTGTKQSPIDVVTASATIPAVDPGVPIMMAHDTVQEWDFFASTYALTMHRGGYMESPVMLLGGAGGPFMRDYTFAFAEFHFGPTDDAGSEHTFDGVSSPMEVYLVYHDTVDGYPSSDYDGTYLEDSIDEAFAAPFSATSADPAKIATISVHFEIQASDNPKLAPLIAALSGATPAAAGSSASGLGDADMKLSDLLPDDTENFYYYNGSLTAPTEQTADDDFSCLESVSYVIYSDKVGISTAQLSVLRTLGTGIITPTVTGATATCGLNSRAVQTNANTVYHRRAPNNANAIGTLFASSVLSIGTFGTLYNFLTAEENADLLTNNPLANLLSDAQQRLFAEEAPAVQERTSGYQANHHHHPQNVQY